MIFSWTGGLFMVREELVSKLSFRPITGSHGPRPCGVAPPTYSMGQGVKLTDHTSPSSAKVNNMWSYAFRLPSMPLQIYAFRLPSMPLQSYAFRFPSMPLRCGKGQLVPFYLDIPKTFTFM
jgi:hypothetical protein